MCLFITIALPENTDLPRVEAILHRHGRCFKPISASLKPAFLRSGDRYGYTTCHGCDCGTPIGAHWRELQNAPMESTETKRRAMLSRQGWSAAKIDRHFAQIRASHQMAERVARREHAVEAEKCAALLVELTHGPAACEIRLLVPQYRGALEAERFPRLEIVRVRTRDITAGFIPTMREDVVYEFCN